MLYGIAAALQYMKEQKSGHFISTESQSPTSERASAR
jgi:hypothetical protein